MNTDIQRWCAWAIVPFLIIYLIAFAGIAGFVPPHAPTLTSGQLMEFYNQRRFSIQLGQMIAMASTGLMLLWAGSVSAQMARIEKGPLPMLSLIQFGAAALLVVLFMLCSLIWIIASYRDDISPELLRMLNDSGWLIFVMAYPEYVVQLLCIGVVGLSDRRPQPFLPRWFCFFTFWVAFAGTGGGLAVFFKTGPFAWNGLVGFWLPVGFFLVWLVLMLRFQLAAIGRQETEEGAAA